jgi:hypothetical protein
MKDELSRALSDPRNREMRRRLSNGAARSGLLTMTMRPERSLL